MLGIAQKRVGLSILILAASGLAMAAPAYAASYYPLYYTASYNGNLYRQQSPFQVTQYGISETNVTSSGSTTITLAAGSKGSTSAGFVVEGGPIGSLSTKQLGGPALAAIKANGTGNFQVNLWIDANPNNDNAANGDWLSWNAPLGASPSQMTSEGGDIILQGPQSTPNGQVIINGSTRFLDEANGKTYTLNDIQSGQAPGISATDNVAVWVGVNSGPGSNATITGLKVNSTPVPLGQLPEVPYAAALPLAGGIVAVAGVIWQKRRNRA